MKAEIQGTWDDKNQQYVWDCLFYVFENEEHFISTDREFKTFDEAHDFAEKYIEMKKQKERK